MQLQRSGAAPLDGKNAFGSRAPMDWPDAARDDFPGGCVALLLAVVAAPAVEPAPLGHQTVIKLQLS
jgi:hypothetical protein